jgi:hypothetical protein
LGVLEVVGADVVGVDGVVGALCWSFGADRVVGVAAGVVR